MDIICEYQDGHETAIEIASLLPIWCSLGLYNVHGGPLTCS